MGKRKKREEGDKSEVTTTESRTGADSGVVAITCDPGELESLLEYCTDDDDDGNERDDRRLFLTDDITPKSSMDIIKSILAVNKEDAGIDPKEREPIVIYISSSGGSEMDGLGVVDAIMASTTPVYTVNIGYALSMAFHIYMSGHKRFATKHSSFMMHSGSLNNVDGIDMDKLYDFMEYQRVTSQIEKELITSRTTITSDEFDKRRDWWLLADQAKSMGIVQYVIGEDCSIDQVC